MSFATQSAKRHAFGRSFLTQEEKNYGVPWYRAKAWTQKKDAIARRVERKIERATLRRLEREDLAKGITPEKAKARTLQREVVMNPRKFSISQRTALFLKRLLSDK